MKLSQSNLKSDQIRANLFFLGIGALIAVILWIATSVYGAYSTDKTDEQISQLLEPIDPTLDLEVINEYQQSRVNPSTEFEITITENVGQKTNTYTLNPFTNTTTEQTLPSPTASASAQ